MMVVLVVVAAAAVLGGQVTVTAAITLNQERLFMRIRILVGAHSCFYVYLNGWMDGWRLLQEMLNVSVAFFYATNIKTVSGGVSRFLIRCEANRERSEWKMHADDDDCFATLSRDIVNIPHSNMEHESCRFASKVACILTRRR
jgi:hypothetical protein